jgi:hypothetical protein
MDKRRSDNVSRTRPVTHLDAEVHVTNVLDPADKSSSPTERIATRTFFVGEAAPFVVFDQFPILSRVKIKPHDLPRLYAC